ncbi:GIY-YIG nuclease family protein [bacterium]|nr:GIY-YIG nuclease family protein [bacterium]
MYFVYILQSLSTSKYYIGSTNNILRRFHQHQSGYSKSTRNRGPWFMPYYEIYKSRSEAVKPSINTTFYIQLFKKKYLGFNYFVSISFACLAP